MSYIFGDGFDLYALNTNAVAGYWDGGSAAYSLIPGRFTGSQALRANSAGTDIYLIKNSGGANDPVHHVVCALRYTGSLAGTNSGAYLLFSDGATNQCCVVFRSDGAILLQSGTVGGATLATYTGAVTASGTWFAFEFEVTIHPTAGRFRARKNGNPVDDFDSGAVLNTRPGTNTYANRLSIGNFATAAVSNDLDDILWRSDATSVPWVGDVRCYTRYPATTAQGQFLPSPSPAIINTAVQNNSASDPTGTSRYTPFTATYTGTIGTIAVFVTPAFTGNLKCSLFSSVTGAPAAVLGSATVLVNPVIGLNIITFPTPVAVVKGTQYWFGLSHDVTAAFGTNSGTAIASLSTSVSYASFPVASPTLSASGSQFSVVATINITPTNNAEFVSETLQDGTTTYVYDSTVGHADFYNIAALSGTPASTIATIVRGYIEKSDAGSRFGTVQLKSGAATVTAPSVNLSTNFGWAYRVDTVDPNTGAAWTAAAVNAVQIGPTVIS